MSSQRGGVLVISLILVALVAAGGAGYYFYTQSDPKTVQTTQSTPTPTNTPTPSADSTSDQFVAVDPSQFDYTGYKEHSTPCISFKYPSTWKVSNESIKTVHQNVTGADSQTYDLYGSTQLQLVKTTQDMAYYGTVACIPNIFDDSIEKDLKNPENLVEADKLEIKRISVDDISALRVYRPKLPKYTTQEVGVTGYKDKYTLNISLRAITLDDQTLKEFDSIVASVKVIDIYNK